MAVVAMKVHQSGKVFSAHLWLPFLRLFRGFRLVLQHNQRRTLFPNGSKLTLFISTKGLLLRDLLATSAMLVWPLKRPHL